MKRNSKENVEEDVEELEDSEEAIKETEGRCIGSVFDYFSKVSVAAVKLEGSVKIGDKIRIRGSTTDFEQTLKSMQSHNKNLEEAGKRDEVGIKVDDKVRRHDKIYVIE